jgi:hypothetical protein
LGLLKGELGIEVVRIFLLGNAANYGTVSGGRTILPAQLDPRVSEQLGEMFQAFADEDMLVIPSLIDFKAFGQRRVLTTGPPECTNGCTDRHAIVNDATTRRGFFSQVLTPFLTVSRPFRDVVYAWEVLNEPIWNVNEPRLTSLVTRVRRDVVGKTAISKLAMQRFLQEAVDIIEHFDVEPRFKATVGHRFARDLERFPTGKLPQFHYYPLNVLGVTLVDRTLPSAGTTRAFLGEVAAGSHGHPWPELNGADAADPRTRVVERLRFAQAKGYPLTLLWPDEDGGSMFPGPDPLKLSPAARAGVVDFQKLARD